MPELLCRHAEVLRECPYDRGAAQQSERRTLVERRISRARLEDEHIAAQNRHLHLQHVHDRLRLAL